MLADTTGRGAHATTVVLPSTRGAGTEPTSVADRVPLAAMSALGGALTVLGGVAPWLSFFAGLQPVRGIDGSSGVLLVALGGSTGLAATAYLLRGGPAVRWLLGILGFATLALAGYLGVNLLVEYSRLAADPLLVARLEPGLGVVLIGGALVAATLFAPDEGASPSPARRPATAHIALAAMLFLPGLIHVALTQEHLVDSIGLGVGFLSVGIVQIVLAPLLLLARTRPMIGAALAVSAASALVLIAAITVGLPLVGHGSVTGALGRVEPVDDLAGLTILTELSAAVIALRLLRRNG
jgi:hypothetical protein